MAKFKEQKVLVKTLKKKNIKMLKKYLICKIITLLLQSKSNKVNTFGNLFIFSLLYTLNFIIKSLYINNFLKVVRLQFFYWKNLSKAFSKLEYLFFQGSNLIFVVKSAFSKFDFFSSNCYKYFVMKNELSKNCIGLKFNFYLTIKSYMLVSLFNYIFFFRSDTSCLRLELKNLGESLGLKLLKRIELWKIHVIRFKSYFKNLILNTGINGSELKNYNQFGIKKYKFINYFLQIVNLKKKKFRFWPSLKLHRRRSLFFLLYRFCLFLKRIRNTRVKRFSDLLYSIVALLKGRHLKRNVTALPFYWNYANRWPIEVFMSRQSVVNKELNFINYLIFFSCLQVGFGTKSEISLVCFFINFFKSLILISRSVFNVQKWRGEIFTFKNFVKYLKITFVRLFKFNRYFLLVLNSLKLNINKPGLKRIVSFSQGGFFNYHFWSSFYKGSLDLFSDSLDWVMSEQKVLGNYRKQAMFKKEFLFMVVFIRFFVKKSFLVNFDNILIELHQRLTLWLVKFRYWFDFIADKANFFWQKNLDQQVYKKFGKKKIKQKKRWVLWRNFKRNIKLWREQRFKFFYKNNLILTRYFTSFYSYKFSLLQNTTFRSFVSLLECKLDVLFFRLGFARDIFEAKYLIKQGNALVNDIKINFLSFFVAPGSVMRATENLWGKFIWKKNLLLKWRSPPQLNYLEQSDRLSAIFLVRKPFINELLSTNKKAKFPMKDHLKWLFWLI